MREDITRVASNFKSQTSNLSDDEILAHNKYQEEKCKREYFEFYSAYNQDKCCLCGKPFSTISESTPCLHWLLKRCKFKKNKFKKIYEKYDFYNIYTFLRWVSHTESGAKNINNLKEDSSNRKIFETTIKWKNIEWTLDCCESDLNGHLGTKTEFPHWHFQMRIDGNQFINFNDYHIPFSKDDLLKITLERDPESGFFHTFGSGGDGMQELMDRIVNNFDNFIENSVSTSNPEDASIQVQSLIFDSNGIDVDKLNKALDIHKETGKALHHCVSKVFESDENVLIKAIVSPSEYVTKIAKRTERKSR